ncbi:MAG: MraZ C-terminal domain-containing protein [Cellulosilyticaceae bacterium]
MDSQTDKQGRILIPSQLKVYSEIEKDIVFIGMGNRI